MECDMAWKEFWQPESFENREDIFLSYLWQDPLPLFSEKDSYGKSP